ncbi:uncharacterized protein isoform X1 [Rhodnius prolixus]|uniref:uncharacterized protein isoform X1 n=1 Tax=Rhodnius prolixus TaxID=13249 RepID=UPI003D18E4BD
MSSEESNDIPESGAVFTFGKSRFADNIPSHFFVRKDPIINISCGDEHTVVICPTDYQVEKNVFLGNGRAFSFGRNSWGELGLSHRMAVGKPNCIKSLKPRKSVNVACGRAHTLILTDCGQVFSCGNNDDGQLGVQDILCRDAPQEITSVSGIKQVSTGANHSTALNVEGKVYVWGSNKEGQLGLGVDVPFINVPTQLNLECKIVQIACGYYHTLLLSDEGKILAFGEGECGKLGTGDEVRRNEPTLIKSSNIIQFVAAGGNHSAAITSKGKLLLWGSNDRGQLGINIKDYVNQPKLFTALAEDIIIQVSCGENHTAIVTETGTMYTFGDNKHGKLCLDKNDDHVIGQSTYPIKINKFETYQVLKVSCGGCHTMVLAAPRTIGTTSNPFLQNTGRKANMLEGKLSDNNDSESLCSTKSSTKLILPPLQKCNRVQSTIPSPATTPPEPCNLTVDIPTINTVFADNSENNQINSPPKTPDTASQPEEVKAHCEENNMDKKECNTFNDINHTKPIKKSSSFCQPENKVSVPISSKSCKSVSEDSLDVQTKCLNYVTNNTDFNVLNNNSLYENVSNNTSNDHLLNETCNMDLEAHFYRTDSFESWYKKQRKEMELVSEQIHKAKINLKHMFESYKNFDYTNGRVTDCSGDDSQDICCSFNNYEKWCQYCTDFHNNNICYPTIKYKSGIPNINHNCSRNKSDINSYDETNQINSSKEVISYRKDNYLCGKEYWGNIAWEDPGAAGDGPQVARFQLHKSENRIEDEVISGKRDDKAVSNESHEINGDFKQDRSCGEKKLLAKYLKIKEKTKAQNAIHYSNKGSLKYSERKSKMCVIL